jgi:hypothetical protein
LLRRDALAGIQQQRAEHQQDTRDQQSGFHVSLLSGFVWQRSFIGLKV